MFGGMFCMFDFYMNALRILPNSFVCAIAIAHGKNAEKGIKAYSVDKAKKAFKEAGLTWPPKKK